VDLMVRRRVAPSRATRPFFETRPDGRSSG
jgi:hypothetical protein